MNITEFIDTIINQLINGLKNSVASQIESKHSAYNKIQLDKQEFINTFITKDIVETYKVNNPYVKSKSKVEIMDLLYELEINKLSELLKISVAADSANLNFDFNLHFDSDRQGNQIIEIVSKNNGASNIQCKMELKIDLQN